MLGYEAPEGASGKENYAVVHSSAIAVLNPQGELVALVKPAAGEGEVVFIDTTLLLADFAALVNWVEAAGQ